MDREVLFRGKTSQDRWEYGSYLRHINRTPCCLGYDRVKDEDIEHVILKDEFSDWNMPRGIGYVHVDPNTVGEFTGMVDKNGKKIFEGDIVRRGYDFEDTHNYVVLYSTAYGGWITGFYERLTTGTIERCNIEVVGNIYDNPELLEEIKDQLPASELPKTDKVDFG